MTCRSVSAAPADRVADVADAGDAGDAGDAADFAELAVVVEQARVTLEVLGGKWVVPIVGVLSSGAHRHGALRAALGAGSVSQKVLTETLRRMEAGGLVVRRVRGDVPPAVLYGLTDLGRSLLIPIRHLAEWASVNSQRPRRR
jgi:DNA-binding HxlR family transcriptional regulator